jgi:hypothetical protein
MNQEGTAARGELVHVEQAPMSRRALLSKEQLKEEAEQRRLLGEYVRQEMKEGTDFGKIPNTEKPTLLKPGAEKLVALFHCSPEFILVDSQCEANFDKGFFKYTFRCIIRGPGGAVLAEGYGSANSREARYRWRTANRKCPACGKEAIIQGKAEYGGGWVCFKKKDGCGAKFATGAPAIESQPVGRMENPDIADLDNTILKMAKKRAHVDGAIALARCSDMFTQDVEDFAHHGPVEGTGAPAPEETREEPPPDEGAGHTAPSRHPSIAAFGPYKGKLCAEMTDAELSETIDIANQKLLEQPTAKWARAMRQNLTELEMEAQLRSKVPATNGASSAAS